MPQQAPLKLYNPILLLAHLMAVLCYCMFHQRRRVAGGRDPAFGGVERGFVCFSLHAHSLFVACWCASSVPSASLSSRLTASRPCFEGRGGIRKQGWVGKKEERIQVLWFNLTCQDLTNCFFFLDRWFEVQNEGTEGSFRANVGDSLLFPGCMRRGGGVGGWPGLQR